MEMMEYVLVEWIHEFVDEPRFIYSELDDDRYELRKIEVYDDGRVGYAFKHIQIGETRLGEIAFPLDMGEIDRMDEFHAKYIKKALFESLWEKYVSENT